MEVRLTWRIVTMLLLAFSFLLAGAVAAQEEAAELLVKGSSTVIANDVEVAAARQLESVSVVGRGFQPGELIGFWRTQPDGSVIGLDNDDIVADATGAFVIEVRISRRLPTGLHRFSAQGQTSGQAASALFFVQPGVGPEVTPGTTLTFTPAVAKQLDNVELRAAGYRAGEIITIWITQPDGSVIGLGDTRADEQGSIEGSLFLPGSLPVGRHMFTARGNTSGNTAIAALHVEYGNGLDVPGAQLAVAVDPVPQGTILELSATGFTPNESVSLWLTKSDGAVLGLGDVRVDGTGKLSITVNLSERLPLGTHYLSFRANVSQQVGFVKFTLEPPRSQ